MTVLEKIQSSFAASNIEYEFFEHEYVRTSEDAAKIRNLGIDTGAKAIIFIADKKPILVVIRGCFRVSTKKLKRNLGFKDVRLATPEEVVHLTGLEIGSIPPLGSVFEIDCYYDASILDESLPVVAFNPGSHYHSIVMQAKDLLAFEQPKVGDFKNDD